MVNSVQYKQTVVYRQEYPQISKNPRPTASEWNDIWLNNFEKISRKENVESGKTVQMRKIISVFLRDTPGSPYCIKEETFAEYLKNADTVQLDTIRFFYDKVAISVKHQEKVKCYLSELDKHIHKRSVSSDINPCNCKSSVINQNEANDSQSDDSPEITRCEPDNGIQNTVIFSDAERCVLLEKLKLEIDARNLSSNTVSNYLSVVSRFLNRLTIESSKDWYRAFKEHLVWLRDDQKLAPSTINNYAAAISFFMEEVLEIKPGEDLFIRMRTGRALPRVHSLQQIALIINAPTNYILRPDPELSNQAPSYSHADIRVWPEAG